MNANVEKFYDAEAKSYDQLRWSGPVGQYVFGQYDKLVSIALPINKEAKYLEIGCGTGRFTVPIAAKGVSLTAVDISDEMLRTTLGRIRQELGDTPSIEIVKADAKSLQFPNESFDIIYSFNAINHIPGYEQVVVEAVRLLKPGGRLVLGYPSLWSLYFPYAFMVNLLGRSLRRGVYTRWPSTPALNRQAISLGLERERSFGMFHCPAIGNKLISNVVASLLRMIGPLVERNSLQAIASTRIIVFKKVR